MAILGGCFRGVVALALLAVVVGIGWFQRDRLVGLWHELRGTAPVLEEAPSPEAADRAEAKLSELAEGVQSRVSLSETEVQSLLLYRYQQLLPAFVDSPRVELDGDRLRLRIRVPADRLPRVEDLGEAAALLPDTAELSVRGQLLPLDSGRVAFAIDDVTAARIPLPHRLVAPTLERLGRADEPGLPRDAVALPLPPGAAGAYVRADSLVLLARPAVNGPRT
jgi:hypothetical protein